MAKYTDDEVSIDELNKMMGHWIWNQIRKRYPKRTVKAFAVNKTVELAVLYFLNPHAEENRTQGSCAAFIEEKTPVWIHSYSDQRYAVIHKLAEMQSDADGQIRRAMRRE